MEGVEGLRKLLTEKEEKKEQDREKIKQQIIDRVRILGCAHRGEIAVDIGKSPDMIFPIVGELITEGRLLRQKLDPVMVPNKLEPRLEYFWSIGLKYFQNFNKKLWVVVPEEKKVSGIIKQERLEEEVVRKWC